MTTEEKREDGGAELTEAQRKELDFLGGVPCVVRYQFGSKQITQHLFADDLARELWQDAAFQNGAPLVKITIEYAPEEAAKLRSIEASDDEGDC